MPDCGIQTWLSMLFDAEDREFIDEADCDIIDASMIDSAPQANPIDLVDEWGDCELWPDFPPDYFGKLGRTHVRHGHKASRSYKYEVKQIDMERFGGAQCFFEAHVAQPLNHWLAMRHLSSDLVSVLRCGEMPFPGDAVWHFTKFAFCSSVGRSVPGPTKTVWHGTYFNCLGCIFHTRTLHASDPSLGLGMDNHVPGLPAIYTASTLHHALGYAFPTNLFGDNLYYSVALELEVSTSCIAMECNKGEVLISPHGCYLIRHV